ncbi:MAG: helix-hairpin-helix domain-containing protein, partial [Litorilinea sp.]
PPAATPTLIPPENPTAEIPTVVVPEVAPEQPVPEQPAPVATPVPPVEQPPVEQPPTATPEPQPDPNLPPGEGEPTPTWTPVSNGETEVGGETGGDDPLLQLTGMDAERADRLRFVGIFTLADVAAQNPSELAGLLGVSPDEAAALINEARVLSQ